MQMNTAKLAKDYEKASLGKLGQADRGCGDTLEDLVDRAAFSLLQANAAQGFANGGDD